MIQDYSITLAAGAQTTVRARGTLLVCKSATAEFYFRPSGRAERTMNAGGRFGAASTNPRNYWTYINFRNASGASNTIEFISADEAVEIALTVEATNTVLPTSISNEITACIAATPVQILKTSTAAAAPVALTAAQTYFRKAIVYGVNTLAGVANTGSVYIGPSATASQQPIEIAPGAEYVLEPPNGAKWNLADWYLDVGTNGDGVVVIYT